MGTTGKAGPSCRTPTATRTACPTSTDNLEDPSPGFLRQPPGLDLWQRSPELPSGGAETSGWPEALDSSWESILEKVATHFRARHVVTEMAAHAKAQVQLPKQGSFQ